MHEAVCIATIRYVMWQNTSYGLRVTSYYLRVNSLKARVEIQECEFKFTSYELNFKSYEFNFTSYDFKSTSYKFKFLVQIQEFKNHLINENSSKQPFLPAPFVLHACTRLEYPRLLGMWSHRFGTLFPVLTLFAIVSSYCFTSEIPKFMT